MELDAIVNLIRAMDYRPLVMNSAGSKTWLKESPKPPQIRFKPQHNDQHRLDPAQGLCNLENAQLKQRRDESNIVSDNDSARFTLDRTRIPRADSLADLFANAMDFRVEISADSEALPGERREIDVELDA